MPRVNIGPKALIYPMPALLVGALVDGEPNFMTAAWGQTVNADPPMVAVAIRPSRHTMRGVLETRVFSLNVPSADMAEQVDYCGLVSGAEKNKAAACGFTVVAGEATGAPLVDECPVSLECEVERIVELPSHNLVIGVVKGCLADESLLDGSAVDPARIDPLAYMPGKPKSYARMGGTTARAFQAGLALKEGGE